MNPRYLKDRICEELEDASHYLKKAIDCMKMYPEWSKSFMHMAEGEQEHATDLYRMFMEMYTTAEKRDHMLEYMRDGIMECFSVSMRKIEDLKTTYYMMLNNTETKKVETWTPSKNENPPVHESSTIKAISN